MSDQNSSIREQVRSMEQAEFSNQHTKKALEAIAEQVGVEDLSGTKADIVARIYEQFPAPDPSLRENSTIDSPVAFVWQETERLFREAETNEQPKPRRKDVVQHLRDQGVAYHTARTQYQAWYQATDGGVKKLGAIEGLPKKVAEALAAQK